MNNYICQLNEMLKESMSATTIVMGLRLQAILC